MALLGGGAVMACTLPDMRTDVAPTPKNGGPVQVDASFTVLDILGVDDVNQQINVDIGAMLVWQDPRLQSLEGCRFARSQVWVPDIVLQNSSNLRTARNNARDQVVVGAEGRVTYRQRFFGDISSYHNLRDFPFDTHDFAITFLPVETGVETVKFVPDQANTWLSDHLNISGWQVNGLLLEEQSAKLREAGQVLSMLTLTISAEREVNYYLFRIMLPLFFVVAMSWVIFWVPPSRFEFQIGLGATSMLTVIAFNLAVAGALPPLGYLTILDQILIWSIAMVFLAIAEALVTGLHVVNGQETRAHRIDRLARMVFPILLIGGWATLVLSGLR
ncbi:MAG: hypothetical protein RID11_00365 [Roseovarius sp.]|uniref:hypothetical protein n=1 Tax=Roseovarius sp. TaxID=1486281 RepID=UPI0032F040FD